MKRLCLSGVIPFLFTLAVSAQSSADPVLMTVGDTPVTRSEFEYMYHKNNGTTAQPLSVEEYVRLYADLKRKVAEAESLGLDTTESFLSEYAHYRREAARPYLRDSAYVEQSLREAFRRTSVERSAGQIYIPCRYDAAPTDTLAAYEKIQRYAARLAQGESFEALAAEAFGRPDYDGNVGFVIGFQTVLPYEDMLYSLDKGSVSRPFRTVYGYHIIRYNDSRPALGEVTVAHIMKRFPKDAPQDSIDAARRRIEAVNARLLSGEDFFKVAREETEHLYSRSSGGRIHPFRHGRCEAGTVFDSVAFSLVHRGDVSEPFQGAYGFHIVKLLDRQASKDFVEDHDYLLRRMLSIPDRRQRLEEEFIRSLKTRYDFRLSTPVLESLVVQASKSDSDSIFLARLHADNTPLFSYADQSYSVADLAEDLPEVLTPERPLRDNLPFYVDGIAAHHIFDYEDLHLEDRYPAFRFLVQEYYDGLLMFAVSSSEVWERAAADSIGLSRYFETHRADYAWSSPRFKGMLVSCADKSTFKTAKQLLKTTPADSLPQALLSLNPAGQRLVRIERGLFAEGENDAVDAAVFKHDNAAASAYPYTLKTKGSRKISKPEDYTDVRAAVTADYQASAEAQWLDDLRKKYPLTLDQSVLRTVR